MPKEYEKIRDSLERRGKSAKVAKRIAAATWNKRHPENPNPWGHEHKHLHSHMTKTHDSR